MRTNDTADADALQDLFLEVTGTDAVTVEQAGSDRREAAEDPDQLAGRTESEGLSAAIEPPEAAL